MTHATTQKQASCALRPALDAVRRRLVWLSRIRHCRGFGIQSPSDYRFVCDVVNDRKEYGEYAALQQESPIHDAVRRKLCRLCFRIARHSKPRVCYDCTTRATDKAAPPSDEARHIAAGSEGARIVSIACDDTRTAVASIKSSEYAPDIVRVYINNVSWTVIDTLISRCGKRSVMIAEGIKQGKNARTAWRRILDDKRTAITFDLYYCGVVFFDNARYKQNYIVNF